MSAGEGERSCGICMNRNQILIGMKMEFKFQIVINKNLIFSRGHITFVHVHCSTSAHPHLTGLTILVTSGT